MADVRKNAARLSAAERNAFLQALFLLKHKPSPVAGVSVYDQYVALHGAVMAVVTAGQTVNYGHFGLAFCPWHREYIRRFELELQKMVPGVTLPYWDWSDHAAARQNVFTDAFMGKLITGSPAPMSTGNFTFNPPSPKPAWYPAAATGWRIAAPLRELRFPTAPNRAQKEATLHRGSTGEVWPASATQLSRLERLTVNRPGYHKMWFLWAQLEAGVPEQGTGEVPTHNTGHRFIGGHMGGAFSPNDPIFWLHHANVDRLWAKWQEFQLTQPPTAHGRSADYPPNGQRSPVNNRAMPPGHNLGDEMWPWVSNPAAYAMTAANSFLTPLIAGLGAAPVRRVQDVLDPAAVGYSYA